VAVTTSGRAGFLALIGASVLWGTTGTVASFLPDSVSPLAVGASTMGIGGVLLFLTSIRASRRVLVDPVARRWILIGAAGVIVYPLAFYSSMDQAGVAIGNVVSLGSGPVFAAIYEWLWERRGLSVRWSIATSIAVVGIALLSTLGHAEQTGGTAVPTGVLLGLLAGISYALFTYASTRAIGEGHTGRGVTGAMFGTGAVILIPVLLVFGAPLLQSGSAIILTSYLAIGPMFVAYILFGFGLTYVRSSSATTVTLIEPVVATILAVAIVGERLTILGWAALILILIGITVLITARQPPKTGQSS
jgi:DME family drug/metabolite transporter